MRPDVPLFGRPAVIDIETIKQRLETHNAEAGKTEMVADDRGRTVMTTVFETLSGSLLLDTAPEVIATLISEVEKLRIEVAGIRGVHAVVLTEARRQIARQIKKRNENRADNWDKCEHDYLHQVNPTNPWRTEYPDEPLADVIEAYETGRKVVTRRPDNSVNGRIETP